MRLHNFASVIPRHTCDAQDARSRLGVFLQRIERHLDLLIKSKRGVDEAEQLGCVQALQQHASDLAGKLRLRGQP